MMPGQGGPSRRDLEQLDLGIYDLWLACHSEVPVAEHSIARQCPGLNDAVDGSSTGT